MGGCFTWARFALKLIAVNVLVFITAALVLEGLASTVFVLNRLWKTAPLAERLYTKYDSDLG